MRTYKIFTSPDGTDEAVKQGWSWPAFFFTWVWAFLKKLWLRGVGTLILVFLAGMAELLQVPAVTDAEGGIVGLVGLLVALVYGSEGNEWRETVLLRRGYRTQGVVEATTPLEAVLVWPDKGRKNGASFNSTVRSPGHEAEGRSREVLKNGSNRLTRLGGWQRLYILTGIVCLLLLTYFVYATFPGYVKHSSSLYKEMGKDARETIIRSEGLDMEDITQIKFPNGHIMSLSNDLSDDEKTIIARDYWKVVEKETNKARISYTARAFLIWLISMILLYALGCGIGWVYNGFKKNTL